MRDYLERANSEILAIGTIEHIDAVNTVVDVIATRGLDLVFIGPGDLACVFRSMPATSSGACRAMIPVHAGPPFWLMPAGGVASKQ